MKLTDAEWQVMEILWNGEQFALGDVTDALKTVKGWNRNTVYTYLTRMAKKGLVGINRDTAQPYYALISREDCAREERNELLGKVYGGAAGDLIAAFLKESKISKQEVDRLKQMLDDMEV